ncbi:MAG: Ig-like domain-containing protein [Gemmatimonadaceae bacterium]
MRFIVASQSIARAALFVIAIACTDTSGPKAGPPASIVLVSGDRQRTTEVGNKLPLPLTINVSDAEGVALRNVTVAWVAAAGTVSAGSSRTDRNGIATMEWILGSKAGEQTATATVVGVDPVSFTATALPGPLAQVLVSRDTVQMLGVGDVFQLSARAADRFGNAVPVRTTVESADTSIVTADNFGTGAFLIAHAANKTTALRATAGSVFKTATVMVLPPPCQPGSAVLNLAVGGTAVFAGAEASQFCVQGTAEGAEFLAIPYYSAFTGSTLLVSMSTGNTTIAATPNRIVATPFPSTTPRAIVPRRDDMFETSLRERSLVELTPLIPNARAFRRASAARFSVSVAVPAVGDIMNLNTNSSSACARAKVRAGRIVAITNRAIIVADTANPTGGFTADDYQSFGAAFDTLVYPVDTLNFGTPTDIDNNGRVILFFTRAVNELTPPGASFYVGGFFFGRDLFPVATTDDIAGCSASNFAEMFYLLSPDPTGAVNQNVFATDFVRRVTIGVLAHELQHLINASRHLYVNSSSSNFEDVFLDEGLAHEAEELVFYRASGLAPGQNLNYATILSSQRTQDAFDKFGASNFGRFREYLTNTQTNSPYADNGNIATRGATWSFLRYAADRRGTGERQMWFDLANPPAGIHGTANLTRVITADLASWLRDWAVANYVDDFVSGASSVNTHPSWNFRSMIAAVGNGEWPLGTRALESSAFTSVSIGDGSAAYLRFGVAADAHGGARITSRGTVVPRSFSLAIVRTK